jgi:predicted Zn finger-like uncharacterized protein
MAIAVTCPECDRSFSVRDEFAGRRGRCPRCGGVFTVPDQADDAVELVEEPVQAARPLRPKPVPARRHRESDEYESIADKAVPAVSVAGGDARLGSPRGSSGSGRRAKRGRSRSGVPVWTWYVVGALLGGVLVGGAVVYLTSRNSNTATAETGKSAPPDAGSGTSGGTGGTDSGQPTDSQRGTSLAPTAAAASSGGFSVERLERDILPCIVKVVRIVNGAESGHGTGFVINDQGWIATNHHVIAGATELRVVLSSGPTRHEVEGLLADKPEHDLAILKPKRDLPGIKVLPLAPESAKIGIGAAVMALGNPAQVQFTITRGVVGRVVTHAQLTRESLDLNIPLPATEEDITWVQHDARIYPGNSGGPLLNEAGQVIGVNTLLNMMPGTGWPMFGLASHVRYVHRLEREAKAANRLIPLPVGEVPEIKIRPPGQQPRPPRPNPDNAEPDPALPPLDPGDLPDVDPPENEEAFPPLPQLADPAQIAQHIRTLSDSCHAADWLGDSDAAYQRLAQLSAAVTRGGEFADSSAVPQEVRDGIDSAIADVLSRLAAIRWEEQHITPINTRAVRGAPASGEGVFLIGQVMNDPGAQGNSLLLMTVPGTNNMVAVPAQKSRTEIRQGTSWIVLGRHTGSAGRVSRSDGAQFDVPVIQAFQIVEIDGGQM